MHRRTTEGMSKAEVIRCLKRYVAREVFSVLRNSALSPQHSLTSIGASGSSPPYIDAKSRVTLPLTKCV